MAFEVLKFTTLKITLAKISFNTYPQIAQPFNLRSNEPLKRHVQYRCINYYRGVWLTFVLVHLRFYEI